MPQKDVRAPLLLAMMYSALCLGLAGCGGEGKRPVTPTDAPA